MRGDEHDTRHRITHGRAGDVGAAGAAGADAGGTGPLLVPHVGRGIEERREEVAGPGHLERPLPELGRVVDQVLLGAALQIVGRRLGRERLCGRQLLPGHVRLRHGALFNRPDRFAGLAVQRVEERLLGGLEDTLDLPAVHRDVHQHRCRRRVVVPDVMMHHLKMPPSLARLHIQRNHARTEEVVAGMEPAVVVHRRAVGDDVDEAEFRVR